MAVTRVPWPHEIYKEQPVIKSEHLRDPQSCLNKAAPDEMVFVLREKDPLFAQTIRLWVTMAQGVHESGKLIQAHNMAAEAEERRPYRYPQTVEKVDEGNYVTAPPLVKDAANYEAMLKDITPGIRDRLHAALGSTHPATLVQFLDTPHGALQAATPRQGLQRGESLERIIQLAELHGEMGH